MLNTWLRPAVRPLKRLTRNAWWRYKGRKIANPPLPSQPVRSVLFVCLGNICRSPFAEVLAVDRARGRDGLAGVTFTSAGIRTKQAAEPPGHARTAAEGAGVSLAGHRPRQLTRELMQSHDLIVVMESSQRDELHARYPDLRHKVWLLSLLDAGATGIERFNIDDPFGQPLDTFRACYRRIGRAVDGLLAVVDRVEGLPRGEGDGEPVVRSRGEVSEEPIDRRRGESAES